MGSDKINQLKANEDKDKDFDAIQEGGSFSENKAASHKINYDSDNEN